MEVKPGYKQTEAGVIPQDWEVRTVGSMGEVRSGKALAVRGAGALRPYLRTKNVFDGRIDIDDVLEMPMTDAEFSIYRLKRGDVLLNEGQSIELVGRCAMYADEFPHPCAIQNQLVRFRALARTSASYATHLFRCCQATGVFSKIAMQTTSVAHLGVSRFHHLKLAWPPTKAEQEAIAGALSDADALIESLEQLVAKKRQIKHGAMQELLTGQKRLPSFAKTSASKETDLGVLPQDWATRPLVELSTKITDGEHLTPKRSVSGYYLLSARNICNSRIDLSDVDFVGDTEYRRIRQRCNPEPGDVLISCSGTIGRVAIVPLGFECVMVRSAALVKSDRTMLISSFLQYFLQSELGQRQIDASLNRGAQPNLFLNHIQSLSIAVPSTAEQTAIGSVLTDMDVELTSLETKLAKARQVKQGMMQQLLTGRIRLV